MNNKFIHLLYVPTMSCNMACKYCYLEDNTYDDCKEYKAIDTLDYAVRKFRESGVVPFNISLHGGEVTTLSHDDFYSLIEYISDYYSSNKELISSAGFRIGTPHIKTNLYGIDKKRAIKCIPDIENYEYVPVNNSMLAKAEIPFLIFERNRGKCFIEMY